MITRTAAAAGGTVVETQGDGSMLAFSSARRAVACARAIQHEIGLAFGDASPPPDRDGTWQGYSAARWEVAGPQRGAGGGGGGGARGVVTINGVPQTATGPDADAGRGRGSPAARGGSLNVVTTHMRAGYLRKNGVPYSEKAVVTEYFDRHVEPKGDEWFTVTTIVEDPKYLDQPFITSTDFRKEPDGAKWRPTACTAR